MVATKDELLAALDDLIDEKKLTITYKWFSRQYDVPYDVSKQLLYERSRTRPGAASGATYFVSGVKKSADANVEATGGEAATGDATGGAGASGEVTGGGEADGGAKTTAKASSASPAPPRPVVALLVSAERLEGCRRKFARITGFHVHSLGPPRARAGAGPAPASPLSAEAATLAGAALEQAQAERLLSAGLQLEGVPLAPERLQEVAGADPPPGTLFSKAALLPIRLIGISRGDADEGKEEASSKGASAAPAAAASRASHGSPGKKAPAHASFASRFGGRSAFGAANEDRDGGRDRDGAAAAGEDGARAAPREPAAFAGGASMLPGRGGGIESLLKGKRGKASKGSKAEAAGKDRAAVGAGAGDAEAGDGGAKREERAGAGDAEADDGGARREEPAGADRAAGPSSFPSSAPASRSRLSLKKRGSQASQASSGSPDARRDLKPASSDGAGSSKRRLRAIESDSESDEEGGEGPPPEYQDEEPEPQEAAETKAPRTMAAGRARQGKLTGASASPPERAAQTRARTPFGAPAARGDEAAAPAKRKRMRTYYNDDGEEVTEMVEEEEDGRGEGSGDARDETGRGVAPAPAPAPAAAVAAPPPSARPSSKPKAKPTSAPAASRAKGKSSGGAKKQAGIASFFTKKA